MTWWPALIVAFLAGSIPFGYLIGRAKGVDLRTVGSRNIGATNLGRVFGAKWFFVCFVLDMLKGFLPTFLVGWRAGLVGELAVPASEAWWWVGVMAAAVLGHMFSPWLGFRGGKGVATGLGALLGIFPALALPGVGTLVVFLVVLSLWRYISAASVAAALSLPLWTWYAHAQFETLRERDAIARLGPGDRGPEAADAVTAGIAFAGWPFVIVGAALAAMVVYRHRANLQRLVEGREPKVGQRVAIAPPTSEGTGAVPPENPPA